MKVFGIGLNKTGTKTLGAYLQMLGMRHRSYDSRNAYESPSFDLFKAGRISELLDIMDEFDSCEDWPWPILYRELDERFEDARFVLTLRKSPEVWYRSLCNMSVRIGPLPLYEKHVYGYSMPHGHRDEYIKFYERHNREVEEYFETRPGKLITLCWEDGDTGEDLARFLGFEDVSLEKVAKNRSPEWVYSGDNPIIAHANRLLYQNVTGRYSTPGRFVRKVWRRLFRRKTPTG